jgi:hypothetical protein
MIRFFLQFLVFAAALLTISNGSLLVLCGADGPLAIFCTETTEDAEEDDREESLVRGSEPIVEATFCVSTLSISSAFFDVPINCGSHNERGPPLASL